MSNVKVAIVGASGYSGEELIRLLLTHPNVDLVGVTSRQHLGKVLSAVYPQFAKRPVADTLEFSGSDLASIIATGAECIFLALPHGLASEFALPLVNAGLRVIDLSADFRLNDAAVYEEFYGMPHPSPEALAEAVYGMPEIHREEIKRARLIASPGCYPTSVILPLVPMLKEGLIETTGIVVNSMSGVSGAGRQAKIDFSYVECNESARPYGLPKHRHLSEIEQELSLAAGESVMITFAPHLVPVNRGILTTTTCRLKGNPEDIAGAYDRYYGKEPFVRLLAEGIFPDLKHVVRSNFIDIAWRHDIRTGNLILLSAEDNLTKGAAGQAVQSMNVTYGWPEVSGL